MGSWCYFTLISGVITRNPTEITVFFGPTLVSCITPTKGVNGLEFSRISDRARSLQEIAGRYEGAMKPHHCPLKK